ncbi:MAG: TPM domain-containing protein [Erysipelotrichaceae bacterium]|nr:TPM domain-containing protein [Erysipelotrichaceae bacterium]MBQ2505895.1 TPM domain-containing protein [Erysipelotrichaceae bacterium]
MKKIFSVILLALTLLWANNIYAAEDHVILENYQDFMSRDQYDQLNEDLAQIQENYDVNIYFIYDTSIDDSDNGVKTYADEFLASHSYNSNNVAIVMSSSYYYVAANGDGANEVIKRDEAVFDRFYSRASMLSSSDPNAFFEGITNAYQYVLELINAKTYQSDAPVSKEKALVNDFSNIMSDDEEERLNRKLQKIKNKYGFDAVVVTTDSFNGMSARDYADDFYDYSQYSKDGILFVLNMTERTWYVSTKGKGIDYFTDYGIDAIFEEMAEDLSDGKYYDAFVIYADKVEKYVVNGMQGNVVDVGNEEKSFGVFNVMISAIVGAISSLITSLSLRGRMKNVSRQHFARNYIVSDTFDINGASDMLVNRHVSRTRRPRRDDSIGRGSGPSHMGGGSKVHTSSSGSSHGGHGGHF